MLIEGPIVAEAEAEVDECPSLIGPNAVLQLAAAIEDHLGHEECERIMRDAQVAYLPSGDDMIPEIEAIRLHRWLSLHEPIASFAIAEDAGRRTADYILAHRIPMPAQWLLRRLPAGISARLLMMAIRKHAWTFIGAGKFEPSGAWRFSIDRAQAEDHVLPPDSLFHWYAAVFTRLYQELVKRDCQCEDLGPHRGKTCLHSYQIT